MQIWQIDFNSKIIFGKHTEFIQYGTRICQYTSNQICTLSKTAKILLPKFCIIQYIVSAT